MESSTIEVNLKSSSDCGDSSATGINSGTITSLNFNPVISDPSLPLQCTSSQATSEPSSASRKRAFTFSSDDLSDEPVQMRKRSTSFTASVLKKDDKGNDKKSTSGKAEIVAKSIEEQKRRRESSEIVDNVPGIPVVIASSSRRTGTLTSIEEKSESSDSESNNVGDDSDDERYDNKILIEKCKNKYRS